MGEGEREESSLGSSLIRTRNIVTCRRTRHAVGGEEKKTDRCLGPSSLTLFYSIIGSAGEQGRSEEGEKKEDRGSSATSPHVSRQERPYAVSVSWRYTRKKGGKNRVHVFSLLSRPAASIRKRRRKIKV